MTEQKLIFLHNTRSSGNSINYFFAENFYGEFVKLGYVGDHFYTVDDVIRRGKDPEIRYILGHNTYGIHRHFDEPCEYFTSVRDPIERLVSGYRAWSEHGIGFEAWLKTTWETENGMTRRLCGIGTVDRKPYDFIRQCHIDMTFRVGEAEYERALATLESECPITLLHGAWREHTMLLFERRYQLPPIFSLSGQHFNHSMKTLEIEEVDEQLLERVREDNSYDYKLLDFCTQRIKKRVKEEGEAFLFEARVRRILSNILKSPGKDLLTDTELNKHLQDAINRLIHFNMLEELTAVLKLVLEKREVSKYFGEVLCSKLSNTLSSEQLSSLKKVVEVSRT